MPDAPPVREQRCHATRFTRASERTACQVSQVAGAAGDIVPPRVNRRLPSLCIHPVQLAPLAIGQSSRPSSNCRRRAVKSCNVAKKVATPLVCLPIKFPSRARARTREGVKIACQRYQQLSCNSRNVPLPRTYRDVARLQRPPP